MIEKIVSLLMRYEINTHQITNIQVSQGKFVVINKWWNAEINQRYPTCAFIKFIFRATIL